jgi:phage terminase large subunit GpA-like protein
LFKASPQAHRMLADHLTAEYRVKTNGRGREVDEWKNRPNRPDNHGLDCLAGAAVAASIEGVELKEATALTKRRPRKRFTAEDIRAIQAERRRGR